MITPWNLYLITRLDYLQGLLIAIMVASVIAFTIALAAQFGGEWDKKVTRKIWFRSAITACISSVLFTLTPTTHEMAAIVIIPAVANNQQVQEIGKSLGELAKQWLEELKPKQ
jgi:hypothetical protein